MGGEGRSSLYGAAGLLLFLESEREDGQTGLTGKWQKSFRLAVSMINNTYSRESCKHLDSQRVRMDRCFTYRRNQSEVTERRNDDQDETGAWGQRLGPVSF